MKKKPKLGRPKSPQGKIKSYVLPIRLTELERAKIKVAADRSGQKDSAWARNALIQAAS